MIQAQPAGAHRGFTLVVCVGCTAPPDNSWLTELRAIVRLFPHGMLVSTPCLLGLNFCATRPGGGAIAMLQPCLADRSPSGPARWVGPILDDTDLGELGDWIRRGQWSLRTLPVRLQNPLKQFSYASRRN